VFPAVLALTLTLSVHSVVPPMVVLLCKVSPHSSFYPGIPPNSRRHPQHPASEKADLRHVKSLMSGAAPLSAELTHALAARIPDAGIGQGYGMTETATTISFMPHGVKLAPLGSAGKLVPGMRARVKPDGSLAGVGERGELVVSGPAMALGYANNAEA
jgi:4-coumarate--CoA ligase